MSRSSGKGKQRGSKDPTPAQGYALYCAQTLLERIPDLQREFDGVRKNEDCEPVHQIRVASRRIRAGLGILQPLLEPRQALAWRKGLRKVTRRLGAARDTDVQIHFIESYLKRTPNPRFKPGLRRLLLRLRQMRQRLQPEVVRALDRVEEGGLLAELEGALRQMVVQARLAQAKAREPASLRQAGVAIATRLEELRSYENSLEHPGKTEEHHAMRIAAKRLRYTLEFFDKLYDQELGPFIRRVKEFQTLLGDLHDCDLWIESSRRFRLEEEARTLEYFGDSRALAPLLPGLEHLRQERGKRRKVLLRKIQKRWAAVCAAGLWSALRKALAVSLEETPATSPPPERPGAPETKDLRAAGEREAATVPAPPVPARSATRRASRDPAAGQAGAGQAAAAVPEEQRTERQG